MNKYFLLLGILFSSPLFSANIDCENPNTTLDINHCAAVELENATAELNRYLLASTQRHQHNAELISAINHAQQVWERYAQAHCDAIYRLWHGGSIRGFMHLSCKTALTQQRTHDLWSSYLTYMDSTPPVLAEPRVSH